MATKSSMHIRPCRVTSSETHNRGTTEYIHNIGGSRVYVIPELTSNNEQWINPGFGSPDLQAHYDSIKRMVKEETGQATQRKERERKGKNERIIKVAGCSPICEGVLLIRPNTTLADVRKFGEEYQRRWDITPPQIFLHKDEGHRLSGQPKTGDRKSLQVGEKWFKPNYRARIVFDWMSHDTSKSQKLNDDDMMGIQASVSGILSIQRGQSKSETEGEHLKRNDFIIEKQRAELQRMDAVRRRKEEQIGLAEQGPKQVKSEIRTDKLEKTATNAVTAIANGAGFLLRNGKMKELERTNEDLHQEITRRDKGINTLKIQMQEIQERHGKQIRNLQSVHNQELGVKNRGISRLNALLEKAFKWFPMFREMLEMEELCAVIGFTKDMIDCLLTRKEAIQCNGKIYSEEHRRRSEVKNNILKVEKNSTDDSKLVLTINRQPINEWFKEQWEKLRQGLRQPTEEPRKSRGFKL